MTDALYRYSQIHIAWGIDGEGIPYGRFYGRLSIMGMFSTTWKLMGQTCLDGSPQECLNASTPVFATHQMLMSVHGFVHTSALRLCKHAVIANAPRAHAAAQNRGMETRLADLGRDRLVASWQGTINRCSLGREPDDEGGHVLSVQRAFLVPSGTGTASSTGAGSSSSNPAVLCTWSDGGRCWLPGLYV